MYKYDKKIIIFDDDENILQVITTILEKKGWEVITYTNCNDVVEKIISVNPAIIFMDNWIPDMGGIKATQLVKSIPELLHIPIVYFSANSEIKSLAAEAGADAYLAKPFNLFTLEELIDNAIYRNKVI